MSNLFYLKCSTVKALILAFTLLPSLGSAGEKPGFPFEDHIDQHTINQHSINRIYGWGLDLFEAPFNHLDGVGANLKLDPETEITRRFTRSPRPDLPGWISDIARQNGPEAQNCRECHNAMSGNVLNLVRDPFRQGDNRAWIDRQPPNIAGVGALQLLAEEGSKDLWAIRDSALDLASSTQQSVTSELITSNDVSYGYITAFPDGTLDTSGVSGIEAEDQPLLISKQFQILPFSLKGFVGFLRRFTAGADATNGLQSPEQFPEFLDGDADGVLNELSVGDITAMTVYVAAQPRPVTKLELHRHVGGKFRLPYNKIRQIRNGKRVFNDVGCSSCHKPRMRIKDPTFNEPSGTPGFSFPAFWASYVQDDGSIGTDPLPYGYDLNNPVSFSLTDLPSVECRQNRRHYYWRRYNPRKCWREFESDRRGGLIVRAYSDLKRHDMGPGLAEDIDDFFRGPSVWRTKELWGVGSTGPWLHDGRATTLTEAIRWHGGDAQIVKDNFFSLTERDQDALIEFLNNLVIYSPERNQIQKSVIGYSGR